MKVAGLILAGGRGRRMGGVDKAFLELAGRPLLALVRARLAPQVGQLAIAAGADPGRFAETGLPALADPAIPGPAGIPAEAEANGVVTPDAGPWPREKPGAGPLAGLLAGLDWASTEGVDALVTAPVDSPFLPEDLVARLASAPHLPALAATPGPDGALRPEGAFGLWPVTLAPRLRAALVAGTRKVGDWAASEGACLVAFPADRQPPPFLNLNRPEDLVLAEAILRDLP